MGKFCQITTGLWPLIGVTLCIEQFLAHLSMKCSKTSFCYRSLDGITSLDNMEIQNSSNQSVQISTGTILKFSKLS